jgi:hypothetical protein
MTTKKGQWFVDNLQRLNDGTRLPAMNYIYHHLNMVSMKKLIALEELAQMLLCLYILFQLPQHVGAFALLPLFFVPDLFAVGFLVSNTLGTILYNFSHHKLVAIALGAAGFLSGNNILLQAGLIAYAHSSFDRAIGYGLKYLGEPDKTHLGFIGKRKGENPVDGF